MKVKVTMEFNFTQEDEEGKEEDLTLTSEEIEDFKALVEEMFVYDNIEEAVTEFAEELDALKDKNLPNWRVEVE
jgi:K+/H+ antiporter YhaU regulatory subunit KhtT